jgi:hypothetical protein
MTTLCTLAAIVLLQAPTAATPATPATAATPATPATGAPPPVLGPKFDPIWSDRINRNMRGVGVGFDQGLWGHSMGQTLKFSIPFGKRIGQFFGVKLRGMMVHDVWSGTSDAAFGGGLELFGRSPVYLGLVRLYGGGGVLAGGRPFRAMGDVTKVWKVGGGGHFGVEFVLTPRMTITLEVGAHSGIHGRNIDAGPSVMAGTMWWFGNLGGRG